MTMPLTLQGRYYPTEEAATALGYTTGRIRQLLRDGEFQGAVKVSERSYLIPEVEINRRLANMPEVGRPRSGERK